MPEQNQSHGGDDLAIGKDLLVGGGVGCRCTGTSRAGIRRRNGMHAANPAGSPTGKRDHKPEGCLPGWLSSPASSLLRGCPARRSPNGVGLLFRDLERQSRPVNRHTDRPRYLKENHRQVYQNSTNPLISPSTIFNIRLYVYTIVTI